MKNALKGLYAAIPAKRHLFSLIRRFYRPPQSLYQHLHFDGAFTVDVGGTAFRMNHHGLPIENEMFWNGITGGWEKASMSLWLELSRRATVILDVGANTGMYTLTAKAVRPDAVVYAFEPVERVFSKLEANCALNRYEVTCVNAAVSNSDGTALLFDTPSPHVYVATLQRGTSYEGELTVQRMVPTVQLDTFVAQHGISDISLLKVDTEGHEVEVLEGFRGCLERMHPTMLIEVLSDDMGRRIEALLPDGYLYFDIDEERGPRRVSHIGRSATYNHLVCTPYIAELLQLS